MPGPITASQALPGGVSSLMGIAAAVVVKNAPGICVRMSVLTAGNITLNDLASTSGGAAANEFFSGAVTAGQVIELDWPCATGIAVTAISSAVVSISYS